MQRVRIAGGLSASVLAPCNPAVTLSAPPLRPLIVQQAALMRERSRAGKGRRGVVAAVPWQEMGDRILF